MKIQSNINREEWHYLNEKHHDLLARVRCDQGKDNIKINAFKKNGIELFRVTEYEIWLGSGLGHEYSLVFEGRKEYLDEARKKALKDYQIRRVLEYTASVRKAY
jgi:hypothetical protein